MGLLSSFRVFGASPLFVLAFVFLTLQPVTADVITKKDGSTISGQILNVSGDAANRQVAIAPPGSAGKLIIYLSDIDTVTMAPPAAVAQVKDAAPTAVVAALEPQIKQFAGLPADWVPNAMAQLAEAYGAQGQGDRALATYNQIDVLYPNSKYHLQAVEGKASLSLGQGKVADALATILPVIDAADKNLAPSQAEGGIYANAFLVYGQALEAQQKPQQALEAYLTVKTMFYQNPTLAEKADQLAAKLREANPGLGVE